jgi:outer membrane protein
MKKLMGMVVLTGLMFVTPYLSSAADAPRDAAPAQAGIKIGYVDLQKVQQESKAGKDAYKTMEKLFKDKQAQLDQRQNEIEKMMGELDKQSALLATEVRKQKEEKLQKDYKELQRFKSDSEEELNKKKAEMAKQMFQEVSAVINKFGKEEGYTLILERSVVLYAPEAVDITDKIVKAYDDSKK